MADPVQAAREARRAKILAKGKERMARILGGTSTDSTAAAAAGAGGDVAKGEDPTTPVVPDALAVPVEAVPPTPPSSLSAGSTQSEPKLDLPDIAHGNWGPPMAADGAAAARTMPTATVDAAPASLRSRRTPGTAHNSGQDSQPAPDFGAPLFPPGAVAEEEWTLPDAMAASTTTNATMGAPLLRTALARLDGWGVSHTCLALLAAAYSLYCLALAIPPGGGEGEATWRNPFLAARTQSVYVSYDTLLPASLAPWPLWVTAEVSLLAGRFLIGAKAAPGSGSGFLDSLLLSLPQLAGLKFALDMVAKYRFIW